MIRSAALALVVGLTSAGAPLAAQMSSPRLFVEGRGGVAVPTFDIADVAKTGAAIGGTLGYMVTPRIAVFGEFDYGMHKDKATGDADIRTLHYMAKVGYSLTGPRERRWSIWAPERWASMWRAQRRRSPIPRSMPEPRSPTT
jgi:hypothetical protein